MDVAVPPAHAHVDQTRRARRHGVHRVAAIDEQGDPHLRADPFQRQVGEDLPVRGQDQRVGSRRGAEHVLRDLDHAVQASRQLRDDRVVRHHLRSGAGQLGRDLHGRRAARVVRRRLEAQPQQTDPAPLERPQMGLQRLEDPASLVVVDLVRRGEHARGDALGLTVRVEGDDVPRKTARPPSEARPQELRADPRIQRQRTGDVVDVRSEPLGQRGDLVDERDLHRQERVRGVLRHLGGLRRGHQHRIGCCTSPDAHQSAELGRQVSRRDRAVHVHDRADRLLLPRADDDAPGRQEVRDRGALGQELGVRGHVDRVRALVVEQRPDHLERSDRRGGAVHEHRVVGCVAGHGGRRLDDAGEVGQIRLVHRGHAHEDHVRLRQRLGGILVDGEHLRLERVVGERLEPELEERRATLPQFADACGVDVVQPHAVSDRGEARGAHQAHMTRAHDRDVHHAPPVSQIQGTTTCRCQSLGR